MSDSPDVGIVSSEPGRPRLLWLKQTRPRPSALRPAAAAVKRGGRTAIECRHSHSEARPATGTPATRVWRATAHGQHTGSTRRCSRQPSHHDITADEFEHLHALTGRTCVGRLRPIDVRHAGFEEVVASSRRPFEVPGWPSHLCHRPCSNGRSVS